MVSKMKKRQLRKLTPEQRESRLAEFRIELMDLRAMLSAGGSIENPGRIRLVKKYIAQILTLQNEERSKPSQ